MTNPYKRFVLLDRDGVINAPPPDVYVTTQPEMTLLPHAAEAIRRFNDSGFGVLVVSNQQCVGKGLITREELDALSDYLSELIRVASGGTIIEFFYCPHLANADCDCRKPRAGLILQAQAKYGFDPAETFLVGDSFKDLEAAGAAGCPSILVLSGNDADRYHAGEAPPGPPALIAIDLAAAADYIIGNANGSA